MEIWTFFTKKSQNWFCQHELIYFWKNARIRHLAWRGNKVFFVIIHPSSAVSSFCLFQWSTHFGGSSFLIQMYTGFYSEVCYEPWSADHHAFCLMWIRKTNHVEESYSIYIVGKLLTRRKDVGWYYHLAPLSGLIKCLYLFSVTFFFFWPEFPQRLCSMKLTYPALENL